MLASRTRFLSLTAIVLVMVASCGRDASLSTTVESLDAELIETRSELAAERERADELERQLRAATAGSDRDDSATVSTTSTTVTDTTDPAGTTTPPESTVSPTTAAPSDNSTPDEGTMLTVTLPPSGDQPDPETVFADRIAERPQDYIAGRCESGDVACLTELALDICDDLRNGEAEALQRLSEYDDDDSLLAEAAVDAFCDDQGLLLFTRPIVVGDDVFDVVESDSSPPGRIPAGDYTAVVDRGDDCFWERKDAAGTSIASDRIDTLTQSVTIAVSVEADESFTTFGCLWVYRP